MFESYFEEIAKLVNNHELPGYEFLTKPLHQNCWEVRDALTSLNEKLREVRLQDEDCCRRQLQSHQCNRTAQLKT